MTGKIKLNAASGGGSVSFQAPSSTGDDRIITLPTTADGTVLTTTNPKAGNIIQVVSTTKTDTASNSTASNTWWDYTAFNAQITTTGSNKVFIQASVSYAVTNANRISMRLRKDGATVSGAVGSSVSSRTAVTSAELHDYGGSLVTTNGFVYLDSPSAGTHTYNIAFKHSSGSTKTLYINKSPDDGDSYSYFRPISTIALMEVAA